jgi:hypothetical protein
MTATLESQNKATVLEAFDTLFNRRDYAGGVKARKPAAKPIPNAKAPI